jgi:hypothetical protein
MAEIKGYIYEEIKNLANKKRYEALQRVENKYVKELEKVKEEAETEITPEVLKAAQIEVKLETYGKLHLDVKIPKDKEKFFEEKFKKLTSAVQSRISKEKHAIEEKYDKWLCEFAKNANEGIVIDLPRFG